MTTVITIGIVVLVAWPLVVGSSAPASARTRNRDAERRARYVAAHPQHANSGDVERLLLAAHLTPAEARLVVEMASDRGIKPFTMWMWVDQYDAKTLAVAVTAGLSHHELLAHLGGGTVPDLEQLKLFASVNGLSVTEHKLKTPVTATVVLTGGARQGSVSGPLPPIFEPGSWPYTEWSAGELPRLPGAGSGGIIAA